MIVYYCFVIKTLVRLHVETEAAGSSLCLANISSSLSLSRSENLFMDCLEHLYPPMAHSGIKSGIPVKLTGTQPRNRWACRRVKAGRQTDTNDSSEDPCKFGAFISSLYNIHSVWVTNMLTFGKHALAVRKLK